MAASKFFGVVLAGITAGPAEVVAEGHLFHPWPCRRGFPGSPPGGQRAETSPPWRPQGSLQPVNAQNAANGGRSGGYSGTIGRRKKNSACAASNNAAPAAA